jgi:four helix bundle protein
VVVEMTGNYKDLRVWEKSVDLVLECYRISRSFPKHETYGLASQLRRAPVSIPANIAEGNSRESRKEYIRHITIAYSSLAELETHLVIGMRLNYIEPHIYIRINERTGEIGKMLNGLRKSLAPS